jgi:hypothetical protein
MIMSKKIQIWRPQVTFTFVLQSVCVCFFLIFFSFFFFLGTYFIIHCD